MGKASGPGAGPDARRAGDRGLLATGDASGAGGANSSAATAGPFQGRDRAGHFPGPVPARAVPGRGRRRLPGPGTHRGLSSTLPWPGARAAVSARHPDRAWPAGPALRSWP